MKSLKLSAIFLLSISTAYAGMDTPLGGGSVDGSGREAKVSLASVQGQSNYYDLYCKVSSKQGDIAPVKFKFDINFGSAPFPTTQTYEVIIDGVPSATHQMQLNDTKQHLVSIPYINGVTIYEGAGLMFTWLAGENAATKVDFNCFSTPSVGLK